MAARVPHLAFIDERQISAGRPMTSARRPDLLVARRG
jgi:hypothetical protein